MAETLGKRIMEHRKRLGMTQDQLAEKLGVSAQAVSKWENDQSCPDITILPRLAELFKTSTDALLGKEAAAPVHEAEIVDNPDTHKKKQGWEFHWDNSRKDSLTFALFVLLVGGLFFIARLKGWEVGFWSILWPSALLIFGIRGLLHRFSFTHIVCSLLGGYFLIDNLGIFELSISGDLIFPALIIIFGISLLIDALRKPQKPRFFIKKGGAGKKKGSFAQDGDCFNCSCSFGEDTHRISLPYLRAGSASVSFGEMTVDLLGCEEIADGCTLDCNCSFGELNLRVPRAYRIEHSTHNSFGSIEFEGVLSDRPKGVIYLTGDVSFGEICVTYI